MKVSIEFNTKKIRGKDRPRFAGAHVYTTPATNAFEDEIALQWKSEFGLRFADYDGEVEVRVQYIRKLPKTKREPENDLHSPDVDNVGKLVLDALNGIAYKDDRQVTRAVYEKFPRFRRDMDWMRIEVDYVGVPDPEWRENDRGSRSGSNR